MSDLLTLRQVSSILGISEARVYQLDDELRPTVVPRGTKMKTRMYAPDDVERVRLSRQAAPSDLEVMSMEVERLRDVVRQLGEIATEGFSRGWDGPDRREHVARIEALVRS